MKANVNGLEIYYETVGSGEPLFMIHGNGEDHTIFAEAAERLKGTFTCYLIDSRGHGQSSNVDSLAYEAMADDMIALAAANGLETIHVYGFSDGGIVGLIMASKKPALVDRLIVSGANTHPRGVANSFYYRIKWDYFWKRDPKLGLMLTQPNIPDEDLQKITAKTLVLAGDKDLIKEAHTRNIAAQIPGATLRILPGEDHGSYIVHNTKIAELILEFVQS